MNKKVIKYVLKTGDTVECIYQCNRDCNRDNCHDCIFKGNIKISNEDLYKLLKFSVSDILEN